MYRRGRERERGVKSKRKRFFLAFLFCFVSLSVRGKAKTPSASRINRSAKGREDNFFLLCFFGAVRIEEGRGVDKSR